MEKLNFYDLSKKKHFITDKYKTVKKMVNKKPRHFAVAKGPSGNDCWRAMSKK